MWLKHVLEYDGARKRSDLVVPLRVLLGLLMHVVNDLQAGVDLMEAATISSIGNSRDGFCGVDTTLLVANAPVLPHR